MANEENFSHCEENFPTKSAQQEGFAFLLTWLRDIISRRTPPSYSEKVERHLARMVEMEDKGELGGFYSKN